MPISSTIRMRQFSTGLLENAVISASDRTIATTRTAARKASMRTR